MIVFVIFILLGGFSSAYEVSDFCDYEITRINGSFSDYQDCLDLFIPKVIYVNQTVNQTLYFNFTFNQTINRTVNQTFYVDNSSVVEYYNHTETIINNTFVLDCVDCHTQELDHQFRLKCLTTEKYWVNGSCVPKDYVFSKPVDEFTQLERESVALMISEAKGVSAPLPVNTSDDGIDWGFIALVAFIGGGLLFVVVKKYVLPKKRDPEHVDNRPVSTGLPVASAVVVPPPESSFVKTRPVKPGPVKTKFSDDRVGDDEKSQTDF